jgi:hypothetical protein
LKSGLCTFARWSLSAKRIYSFIREIGLAVVSFGIGALMALTKSKKHYVGLTWADGDKRGGLAMQCDKNEYRGILAALEGVTGKKAVDSDAMTVKN